jgi:nucleosome binding factor SPN SPT16 subunit
LYPKGYLQEQEENYELLLRLQGELLSMMKDGVAGKEVYNRALAFFRKNKTDLATHVPKNVGFLVSENRQSGSR